MDLEKSSRTSRAAKSAGHLGAPSGPSADGPAAVPILGRTAELARIKDCLEGVGLHGAQILLLEGEPGIGKSTLAAETKRLADSMAFRTLAARTDELAEHRPLGLVADLLQAAGTNLAKGTRSLLGVGEARRGADMTFRASEVLIETCDRLCAEAPLALVLEDLHWSDAASVFALRRIIRHGASLPLAVVATLRPLPRPSELSSLIADLDPGSHQMLGPMEEAAIDRLAARFLGAAPGPELRVQIAMAGGNPLFVLELLDELQAEGALSRRPTASSDAPAVDVARTVQLPSLGLTVLRRLSFLSPDTLRCLGLAAVLGVRFRASALAALSGRISADLVGPIREALAAGLLVEDDEQLRFRHELVREALYSDLPAALRRGLHRDAARILREAGEEAGVWVEHLLRGPQALSREVASQLREAASDLVVTLPSEAVRLLEQAILAAGSDQVLRANLMAERSMGLLLAGRLPEGEAACREALTVLKDPSLRLLLRDALAQSLLDRGDPLAALREAEDGLRDPALDGMSRAWLHSRSAMARLFIGDFRGSHHAIRQAEEGVGDSGNALRVCLLGVRTLLAAQEGQIAEAARIGGEAVALAEAEPSRAIYDSVPHITWATSLIDTDRFDDAAAVLARGCEAQEFFGARRKLPVHHVGLGFTYFWTGKWDEAVAEIETGINLAEETGAGWRAAARGLRAVVAACRGDGATAARWLRAGEEGLAAGEAGYRTEWLAWARVLCLELAEPSTPPGNLLDAITQQGSASWMPGFSFATVGPTVARLALASGRERLVEEVQERLDTLAAENPGVLGVTAARDMVRALRAGDPARLRLATDTYRQAERPLEAGGAAEEAAVLAARAGDREAAAKLFAAARQLYGGLGATALAGRMARRLRAAGVGPDRAPIARARPGHGWDSLTAMERQILRLIVERRSNPEIAGVFVISRRTVETHVSHILTKVGLRSRVELARAAAEHFGWRLRLEEFSQSSE